MSSYKPSGCHTSYNVLNIILKKNVKKSTKIGQNCSCFCFAVDVPDLYNDNDKSCSKDLFFELTFNIRFLSFILTNWGKNLKNYRKIYTRIQLLKMLLHYPR